jgi:hypothetical protein
MRVLFSGANKSRLSGTVILLFLIPGHAVADGVVIEKIYDPYVQPLENELEYRLISQIDDQIPDLQIHSLSYGRSLSDRWWIELYTIGQKGPGENLSIDTYELEAKWQLTEQGEYAFDWGMLFELEREIEENAWEASTNLLASRDIGRVTVTANIGLIYEWGQGIQNEFESVLHLQARYRYKEIFEPVIELHMGQGTTAIGPSITGLARVAEGKKLRWELGIFAGIDGRSPDQTIKANIEFEF